MIKSGKRFNKSDVQKIKLMHKILKGKFPLPLFIVIEKTEDKEKEIENLSKFIKEQLPEMGSISIILSSNIDELIKKSDMFFHK